MPARRHHLGEMQAISTGWDITRRRTPQHKPTKIVYLYIETSPGKYEVIETFQTKSQVVAYIRKYFPDVRYKIVIDEEIGITERRW